MTDQPADRARALALFEEAKANRIAAEDALLRAENEESAAFQALWPYGLEVKRGDQAATVRTCRGAVLTVNMPDGSIETWPAEEVEPC